MKRSIFASLVAVSALAANAQSYYAPKKGDISTEINFNPFSSNFNTFKLDGAGIGVRYFISDKTALRFNLGLSANNNTYRSEMEIPNQDNYGDHDDYLNAKARYDLQKDDKTTSKSGKFSLGVGIERHWMAAKRVDLYAGAQVGFAIEWAKAKEVEHLGDFNWSNHEYDETWTETRTLSGATISESGDYTPASAHFNADVFTGIDFYVYKGLYIGAEIGFGINNKSARNYSGKWETTKDNANPSEQKIEYNTKDNAFTAGFKCIPALRLGWKF